MKSILISIKPEYVEKILNGEKTIEIRKTKPSCELPCKVYIYMTKKRNFFMANRKGEEIWFGDGLRYDKTEIVKFPKCDVQYWHLLGKVVAEFTLNKITTHLYNFIDCEEQESYNFLVEDVKNAGFNTNLEGLLDFDEFVENYGKRKPLYAWHIDDLKIYDKPKELSEFSHYIPNNKCPKKECGIDCEDCMSYDGEHETCLALYYSHRQIKRPPQSWMFVESLEGK